jgi:hypothetical protein
VVLGLIALAFGVVVVQRSVYLKRPQGDAGVFFRAGWAIRAGGSELYAITDDNGWHYHYPPLFALLMVPLADPPRRQLCLDTGTALGLAGCPAGQGPLLAAAALGTQRPVLAAGNPRVLPFAVSIVVVYLLNLLCLAGALHLLARALEEHLPPLEGRALWWRWWVLRLGPTWACLSPIGLTLMRGQVTLLLLLLLSGFITALVRGRRFQAGLWLAGAICLKIIPAYLLLVPLYRRDLRCLTGCAVGLVAGLAVIPSVALGPATTARLYATQMEVLIKPALHLNDDQSRAKELIDATGTQSQSFQTVIHKTVHLRSPIIPRRPSRRVRLLHFLIGLALTAATLAAGWKRRYERGPAVVLLVSLLALLMVVISPVCHLHYFTVLVPLTMVLVSRYRPHELLTLRGLLLLALLWLPLVANAIPMIPRYAILRNVGLPLYAALALWLAGCWRLGRAPRRQAGLTRCAGAGLPEGSPVAA